MQLIETHVLPEGGKFLREFSFKATFDQLSSLLGFEPTGPNAKEYNEQHGLGVIFGFRDESGRQAWIWKDDKVPLGLTTTVHSWAAGGDIALLGEAVPLKDRESGRAGLWRQGEDEEYSVED